MKEQTPDETATIDPINAGVYQTVNAIINLTSHPPNQSVLDGKEELRRAFTYLRQIPGIDTSPSDVTLSEWMDHWLQSYPEGRTRDGHESNCRLYIKPNLGHYPLAQLNTTQIREFFNNLPKLHPTTRSHIRATLHKALEDAIEAELLSSNPASRHHEPLKYNGAKVDPLCPEELDLLLSHREIPYYDEIATAAGTGVRLGELLALPWSCVDLDSKRPSIRIIRSLDTHKGRTIFKDVKTDTPRRIRLFPSTVRVLRERRERNYLGPDSLVFCRDDGTPLDGTVLSKSFSKSLKRLGIRHIRFQDLRHTHATLLLNGLAEDSNMWPQKAVQERLGHASAKMTLDLYGHVMPGMQDAFVDDFEAQQRFVEETADNGKASDRIRTYDKRFTKPLVVGSLPPMA